MVTVIAALDTSVGVGIGIASAIAGLLAGYAVVRKIGPERTQIVLSGTEKAFVIQAGVLDDVLAELERQKKETAEAREDRKRIAERLTELERTTPSPDDLLELQRQNRELEIHLTEARAEVAAVRQDNDSLRQRVSELETAVNGK